MAQEPDWLWTPLTRREEQTLERLGLAFTGAQQPRSRADPDAASFADWVQLKIFVHIYTHYPNVKKEWDKATLKNRWFRREVLKNPWRARPAVRESEQLASHRTLLACTSHREQT